MWSDFIVNREWVWQIERQVFFVLGGGESGRRKGARSRRQLIACVQKAWSQNTTTVIVVVIVVSLVLLHPSIVALYFPLSIPDLFLRSIELDVIFVRPIIF